VFQASWHSWAKGLSDISCVLRIAIEWICQRKTVEKLPDHVRLIAKGFNHPAGQSLKVRFDTSKEENDCSLAKFYGGRIDLTTKNSSNQIYVLEVGADAP